MDTQFAPVEMFCSFAAKDALLFEQLEKHLSSLQHEHLVIAWHKHQVLAGSDWEEAVDRHLNRASLILLLISPDFLASSYCYGTEMQQALQRHEANEVRVIPILLRPVEWQHAPFSKLHPLPANRKPITQWRNRDDAFKEVAQGIKAVLNDVQHLPFSTVLTGVWNVPYRRNPYFTGRDELLARLDQQLSLQREEHEPTTRRAALTQPQVIKGLGGIGKTQIAVEYAYRSREQMLYTHTLWVNAAGEEALFTSFVALADLLPVFSAKREMDQWKLVEAIKRWLEQCQQRWLLIFDNADEITLVGKYLPQRGNGSILLTTRTDAVGSLATSVEVETLGFVEGTHLLLRRAQRFEHASDEEINQAGNIVAALDHFPLALDQAGAYIEETQCSLADYLEIYQSYRNALLARRGNQTVNYPDSVATTWLLSFQKVQQANPAAVELLQLCAFLAPDRIPEELIKDGAAHWPSLLKQAATDHLTFNQMIEDLLKFSLLKRLAEEHALSIHRLVQAVQKDRLEVAMQRNWAERAVRATNDVFPDNPQDMTTWSRCLRYLDQVQACRASVEEYGLPLIEAASMFLRTGLYLNDHALYAIAEPLYQRALAICEEQLGAMHSHTATSLNYLADLYRVQGRYSEAEPLLQRALAAYEQQLGAMHSRTATSLNNLAELYRVQARYEEAEPLLQRALATYEQQLGAMHPYTASCLNNLAAIYKVQGRYEEAEPLYQRARSICEEQWGAMHPHTAHSLHNLATLYDAQDRYSEAEPLYQRALSIYEQQLGVMHPNTATSLHNLATLYDAQGKYNEAEPLYKRALAIYEQRLGTMHPHTASCLNSLATLYRVQGKYEHARPLLQRSLAICEQQLGYEHPTTQTIRENYSFFLQAMERDAEAKQLEEGS